TSKFLFCASSLKTIQSSKEWIHPPSQWLGSLHRSRDLGGWLGDGRQELVQRVLNYISLGEPSPNVEEVLNTGGDICDPRLHDQQCPLFQSDCSTYLIIDSGVRSLSR